MDINNLKPKSIIETRHRSKLEVDHLFGLHFTSERPQQNYRPHGEPCLSSQGHSIEALASPRSLLKMQILGPHFRPTERDSTFT